MPFLLLTACGDDGDDGDDAAAEEESDLPNACEETDDSGDDEEALQMEPASASRPAQDEGAQEESPETTEPPTTEAPAEGEGEEAPATTAVPVPEPAEGPAPDDALLDEIEVSGDYGDAPEVHFDGPIETDKTVRRVLSEGDGEPVEYGMNLGVNMVAYDAESCDQLQDTFVEDVPMVPLMPLDETMVPAPMAEAMLDVPLGSRVASVVSTDDPSMDPTGETPPVVMVMDVHAQEEVELDNQPPEGEPQVKLFNFGEPEVTVPEADPPGELTDSVLIEGDGDEVKAEDGVLANYHGVVWDSGEVFDSTYAQGMPAELPLDGMIEGWTEGLAGQKVGSTVMLTVPPDLAYGAEGQDPIPPDATIVFIVEIMDVFDPEEMQQQQPLPEGAP